MAGSLTKLGALLILMGVIGYVASDFASVTALIPAFVGVPILVCGRIGGRGGVAAGTFLTAVGFLGAARGLMGLPDLIAGESERPLAVGMQSLMAAVCLGFLIYLVRGLFGGGPARPDP